MFFKRPAGIGASDNGYPYRPDRHLPHGGSDQSILTSIYNRIAMDVAAVDIRHVKVDKDGRYEEDIDSGMNNCLSIEANIDQTGRAFIFDAVWSMLDEGCIALVPIDYSRDTDESGRESELDAYGIHTMRVGKIVEWCPDKVKISVFNIAKGYAEEVMMDKREVAILENPFYSVMNSANSTTKKLARKLALLDAVDEKSNSSKLDLIVKLPYVVKGAAKKKQAEEHIQSITDQLTNSKYGIAYSDATESIVQLNRPIENNLMERVEYLQVELFSKLGMTQGILDGTADEKTMNNYYNRTTVNILRVFVEEFRRKYIRREISGDHVVWDKTETFMFFSNPFQMIPVTNLAEVVDKFRRNEVMAPNEFRQILGMKPSKDAKADMLQNSNIKESGTLPASGESKGSQTGQTEGSKDVSK